MIFNHGAFIDLDSFDDDIFANSVFIVSAVVGGVPDLLIPHGGMMQ